MKQIYTVPNTSRHLQKKLRALLAEYVYTWRAVEAYSVLLCSFPEEKEGKTGAGMVDCGGWDGCSLVEGQ